MIARTSISSGARPRATTFLQCLKASSSRSADPCLSPAGRASVHVLKEWPLQSRKCHREFERHLESSCVRPLLVWGSVFSVVDCLGLPSHRQGVQGDRRMSWLQRCMGSIADGSEFPVSANALSYNSLSAYTERDWCGGCCWNERAGG